MDIWLSIYAPAITATEKIISKSLTDAEYRNHTVTHADYSSFYSEVGYAAINLIEAMISSYPSSPCRDPRYSFGYMLSSLDNNVNGIAKQINKCRHGIRDIFFCMLQNEKQRDTPLSGFKFHKKCPVVKRTAQFLAGLDMQYTISIHQSQHGTAKGLIWATQGHINELREYASEHDNLPYDSQCIIMSQTNGTIRNEYIALQLYGKYLSTDYFFPVPPLSAPNIVSESFRAIFNC